MLRSMTRAEEILAFGEALLGAVGRAETLAGYVYSTDE